MSLSKTDLALIESSQRLVRRIARRFSRVVPFEDLVQEGNLGLLRALQTYDPTKASWPVYSAWWVRSFIGNAADCRGVVTRYAGPGKRAPAFAASLDAPRNEDDETSLLETLMVADDRHDQLTDRLAVRQALASMARELDGLSMAVVRRRLMVDEPAKLKDLGAEFGVSHATVHNVEKRICAALRLRLLDGGPKLRMRRWKLANPDRCAEHKAASIARLMLVDPEGQRAMRRRRKKKWQAKNPEKVRASARRQWERRKDLPEVKAAALARAQKAYAAAKADPDKLERLRAYKREWARKKALAQMAVAA